jgi:ferredoxin--NADP+ reductase
MDADETVDCIARDWPAAPEGQAAGGSEGLRALLASRGVPAVDFGGWQRIDAEEVARGKAVNKPREKLVQVSSMLEAAGVQVASSAAAAG